jgi:hypothetical protein
MMTDRSIVPQRQPQQNQYSEQKFSVPPMGYGPADESGGIGTTGGLIAMIALAKIGDFDDGD